jgi:hypothetical protein
MLQRTREHVPYPFDQVPSDEPLDPDAPLTFASWQGRPVVLARREPEYTGGRARVTVPISISRLRRAIDIEGERNTLPYSPSMVDMTPLGGVAELKASVADRYNHEAWEAVIDDALECGVAEADIALGIAETQAMSAARGLEAFREYIDAYCEIAPARAESSGSTLGSTLMSAAAIVGTAVGAYHGYKRTRGHIGWTLAWSLFGGALPIVALPVAVAQGIGKPK